MLSAAACGLLLSLPLAAAPIELRCAIRDQYLTSDYKKEAPIVEKALCNLLRERLAGHAELLAWTYVVGTPAATVLELRLVNEGAERELELELRMGPNSLPVPPWREVWKKPGDAKPDPTSGNAARFFADKVDELLLERAAPALHERLKRIAVADARWSPKGAPEVLSGLSWSAHQRLRASLFRVSCQSAAGGEDLRSEVQGAKGSPDGPILLKATHRLSDNQRVERVLAEVKRLRPERVFLLELIQPDVPATF
jgi:hypothetical protein